MSLAAPALCPLTVQPAASAGATFLSTREAGKFQAVWAATTPTGARTAMNRRRVSTAGSSSPLHLRVSSANQGREPTLQRGAGAGVWRLAGRLALLAWMQGAKGFLGVLEGRIEQATWYC